MAFADDMRKVANDLCKQFGNACVLKKPADGVYDPDIGETVPSGNDIVVNTYSAQDKRITQQFGQNGNNTNLSGFGTGEYIVPWFGYELDTTWLYNDQNIVVIDDIKTQDKVVAYNIVVGEKDG